MVRYRALVELTLPVDEKETERIVKLTAEGVVAISDRKTYRVEAGHIAKYIPEVSMPWLLKQGCIELVEEDK